MKNKDTKKSEIFAVRLHPEDMKRLDNLAAELGISTSRLVRFMILYTSPQVGPAGHASHFRAWARKILTNPLFSL